jgi:hypothetical protein
VEIVALTPPRPGPLVPAPPSSAPADDVVVSARPKDRIPAPRLPRSYHVHDGQDLLRVFALVETEVVSQAGVTPAFASGVTVPLRRALAGAGGAHISPSAMYYFIIGEAGRGHDKRTAAHGLMVAHRSDIMRRLSSLPIADRTL